MAKITDARLAVLQAYFNASDVITEANMGDLALAIQEAAQDHEHTAAGGSGSGAGDAGSVANVQSGLDADKPASPAIGDVYLASDTEKLCVCFVATSWTQGDWPAAGFYDAYVCVRDKKAQNTHGGTFTSGAWRTRDINEELADTAGICSIASNQITLTAGTYRCIISCPAFAVVNHQAQLYNITDSAVLLVGATAWNTNVSLAAQNSSVIAGRFTLAAQKTLEVQHKCMVSKSTSGFGSRCNFADEIYTVAEFWREV